MGWLTTTGRPSRQATVTMMKNISGGTVLCCMGEAGGSGTVSPPTPTAVTVEQQPREMELFGTFGKEILTL